MRSLTPRLALTLMLLSAACVEPTGPTRQSPELRATTLAPTLLVCQGNEAKAAEKIVDPLGGSVAAGKSAIALPVGALLAPTRVKVRVPASDLVEIRVTAGDQEHYTFEQPVTITIDYGRCQRDLTDVTLAAWEIDPETKQPLQLMGGVDDKVARTVTFATTHLSGYALAE